MSNDTKTAKIQEMLAQALRQLENDAAAVWGAANNVSGLVSRARDNRKQLVTEARGIVERHIASGYPETDRLREILDELERLP